MTYRHLTSHQRLQIYELRDILPEISRVFLQNAIEGEINRNGRDNRRWLESRLASGERRVKALIVFDEMKK